MLNRVPLLAILIFAVCASSYANSLSIDSFGVINTTDMQMKLVEVSATGGIVINKNCPLPSDIPSTSLPHPSSTGCSGTISPPEVNYIIKIPASQSTNADDQYQIKLAWDSDNKGEVKEFKCISASCTMPTSHFTLSPRYDSFDGYNIVISTAK